MLTNTYLLRAKIIEKGYTPESLAAELGISSQALSGKINNRKEFKVSEIQKLCDLLSIEQRNAYFFVENIAKMAKTVECM